MRDIRKASLQLTHVASGSNSIASSACAAALSQVLQQRGQTHLDRQAVCLFPLRPHDLPS